MRDIGIMRRVDQLGRFVLPKELRRKFQIECNDFLQIYTEGDRIIIQKAQNNCALCGRAEDLVDFKCCLFFPLGVPKASENHDRYFR